VNKNVYGMTAEVFLDICKASVYALANSELSTDRQKQIAQQASMFLAAVAKVGLIALIDEATGYQYDRAADALRVKLKFYLAEEMRDWEKTCTVTLSDAVAHTTELSFTSSPALATGKSSRQTRQELIC
jgi:hypothetical protein